MGLVAAFPMVWDGCDLWSGGQLAKNPNRPLTFQLLEALPPPQV